MQPPNRLALHEARLVALRERLVRTLGIHTARVLLDRALWQTAQRHPELALIQLDDAGLSFDALEQSYAAWTWDEGEAAFDDLFAELLLILARLLGRETAQRLAEGIVTVRSVTHRPSRSSRAYPMIRHKASSTCRERASTGSHSAAPLAAPMAWAVSANVGRVGTLMAVAVARVSSSSAASTPSHELAVCVKPGTKTISTTRRL